MVVLKVYTKNLKVDYKVLLFSKGTLLIFTTTLLCFILPFVVAYKSGGFWLKRDFFYEQPNVKFKGEYLFYATTTNLSQPILCTSNPFYNKVLSNLDVCTDIKIREIDNNLDTKTDELQVILDVNLPYTLKITSFTLIIPVDYTIHTVCPLNMESAIILQQFTPIFISKFSITSNLNVFQSYPLNCHKKKNIVANEYPILQNFNKYVSLDTIIEEYSKRNISTHLSNLYTNFKTSKTDMFTLNLKVRYPEHKIIYKPKFWHIIKWAWIQYASIYIVVAWITAKIEQYVFDNKLVLFYETSIKKNK